MVPHALFDQKGGFVRNPPIDLKQVDSRLSPLEADKPVTTLSPCSHQGILEVGQRYGVSKRDTDVELGVVLGHLIVIRRVERDHDVGLFPLWVDEPLGIASPPL